jgi:hypothetical protein
MMSFFWGGSRYDIPEELETRIRSLSEAVKRALYASEEKQEKKEIVEVLRSFIDFLSRGYSRFHPEFAQYEYEIARCCWDRDCSANEHIFGKVPDSAIWLWRFWGRVDFGQAIGGSPGITEDSFLPKWLPLTIACSVDDPTKVSWAETFEDWADNSRRRKASLTKMLRKLRHAFHLRISDEEIQILSERVSFQLVPKNYRFEVVDGFDIVDAYHARRFGSCMAGSPAVEFYAHQPNVRLLIAYDEDEMVGRALVWTTTSGQVVLDRVYPDDNGRQIGAMENYGRQQGWLIRSDGLPSLEVEVIDTEHYPYIDTFCVAENPPDEPQGTFFLSNDKDGDITFSSTEGECPWGARVYCELEGDHHSIDEVIWVEFVDSYVSMDYLAEEFVEAVVEIYRGTPTYGYIPLDRAIWVESLQVEVLDELTMEAIVGFFGGGFIEEAVLEDDVCFASDGEAVWNKFLEEYESALEQKAEELDEE